VVPHHFSFQICASFEAVRVRPWDFEYEFCISIFFSIFASWRLSLNLHSHNEFPSFFQSLRVEDSTLDFALCVVLIEVCVVLSLILNTNFIFEGLALTIPEWFPGPRFFISIVWGSLRTILLWKLEIKTISWRSTV